MPRSRPVILTLVACALAMGVTAASRPNTDDATLRGGATAADRLAAHVDDLTVSGGMLSRIGAPSACSPLKTSYGSGRPRPVVAASASGRLTASLATRGVHQPRYCLVRTLRI